jgi:hypothetical protein
MSLKRKVMSGTWLPSEWNNYCVSQVMVKIAIAFGIVWINVNNRFYSFKVIGKNRMGKKIKSTGMSRREIYWTSVWSNSIKIEKLKLKLILFRLM